MNTVQVLIFLSIFISETITFSQDVHLEGDSKQHFKTLKKINKNSPQGCKIKCPFTSVSPEDCHISNANPVIISKYTSTTEKLTQDAPTSVQNKTIYTKVSRKKVARRFKVVKRLTNLQKRKLLKKLKLTNYRGNKNSKTYKFRGQTPILCTIQCEEICDEENNETPQSSSSSSSTEDDSSEDDSYQEGEDTPIEATIKPYVPDNLVVGGVKPFGNVDFMGFDDFGPNGELARDPQVFVEDKHNRMNVHKNRKSDKERKMGLYYK